ncbi:MAG TPA: hypothetical protein VJP58_03050 [Candidatus Nitrosocosmicus sp.]|nr:hypothetical protein [Candidatus Nitrosocosmicus sp.]
MQSNIYTVKLGNLSTTNNQSNLQNLMALDNNSSQGQGQGSNMDILTSNTCKKTITIVFWDISGFSKLTKSFYLIDSENIIIEFLDEYYRIARSTIAHNNGVWDKTIAMASCPGSRSLRRIYQ